MENLSTYIQHPDYIDATVVDELHLLLDSYPYHQVARLLMLQGMYRLQDDRFGAELRKAAVYLPNRARIFELTEGYTETPSVAAAPVLETAEANDRTGALINTFLDQLPETPQQRRPRVADASVDYLSYLMQEEAPAPWTPALPESEETPSKTTAFSSSDEEFENDEQNDEKSASDTCFTETLAQIYIKQGKYAKALEIIRRLNLNFPEKNRYFADQIRFLEKLLINERYHKE